jgi:hypothetical protein
MVEDFRFTHEGPSYRCWDRSGNTCANSASSMTATLPNMEMDESGPR